MAAQYILIVEDEEDIAELIEYNLLRGGYRTKVVGTGETGLESARTSRPDLLLLDLMLPGLGGHEVCLRLKKDPATADIPIVMLTARGEEEDVIAGFAAGADDYINKPFSPKILLARIGAVLRRGAAARPGNDAVLEWGRITIHPGKHEARVDAKVVDLTLTEFKILKFLVSRPGWVFTRGQIVRAVHGDDYPDTSRAVDVQVAALRKKLGDAGSLLETVRGVGYRMGE